jgi:Ribbon-helix-helix domain
MAGLAQPAWTDAEAVYVLAIRLSGRSVRPGAPKFLGRTGNEPFHGIGSLS